MATDYEKLYSTTPHALGEPTKIIVNFIGDISRPEARALDVGCGQGRDALFIDRLGHFVVGIDISESGIADLVDAARKENLEITGIVVDVRSYRPDGVFDIILIDRMLHMLQENDRRTALNLLLEHVSVGRYLLIADVKSNMDGFRQALHDSEHRWIMKVNKGGYLFASRSE